MPVIFAKPGAGIGAGSLIASSVINDSSVAGASVKDALDTLNVATTSGVISRFKFNQPLITVSGTKVYSTLDNPVIDTAQVFVNGLLQEPGAGKDYAISGQIITFTEDLELDDILLASYIIEI